MVDLTAIVGTLDLFELMVNYVCGDILISIFVWALIILITGIMGRMTMNSLLVVLGTFLGVALVGYLGAIGAFPIFIFAMWYMISGTLNWVNQMR